MTETVVLLPFFLLLAFGLLQVGQLSAALLIANYGASAIARQAVQDGGSGGSYQSRFESLMSAGMKSGVVNVEQDSQGLLSNVTVHACAQIDAFPFLGQFLGAAFGSRYSGGGACGNSPGLGPFYFSGSAPYYFRVHGKATARMNYAPR